MKISQCDQNLTNAVAAINRDTSISFDVKYEKRKQAYDNYATRLSTAEASTIRNGQYTSNDNFGNTVTYTIMNNRIVAKSVVPIKPTITF